MTTSYSLNVNGRAHQVHADPDEPVLYVLRNDLQLNGPKFGCGVAQCGACAIIIDGRAVRSCSYPVSAVGDRPITTLDGLGSLDSLSVLQEAFVKEQAVQCGYCINGMIMTAKALLDARPDPSDEEIKDALAANLCRCGTHTRILKAVKRAAHELREA